MKSKPHHAVEVDFFRQPALAPRAPREYLMTCKNILVQKLTEIHSWARELIKVNANGYWQTPEPYNYFYKVRVMGTVHAQVRERMDGTDGEIGAERKKGILPQFPQNAT